jgi:predicted SprT family Zn-dependent metalloprotease
MEYRNRKFIYSCTCGYTVNVFIDFGAPQENYKCRKCGTSIKRRELE